MPHNSKTVKNIPMIARNLSKFPILPIMIFKICQRPLNTGKNQPKFGRDFYKCCTYSKTVVWKCLNTGEKH